MTIKELRAKQDAEVKAAKALLLKASKENRDLNADEQTALDEHTANAEGFKAQAERQAKVDALDADLHASAGRRTQPDSGEEIPVTVNTSVITDVREQFKDDPKKGFKSHREFLSTVLSHGQGDIRAAKDQRLKFLAAAGSDEQSTGDNSKGGFLVPEAYSPNVLQLKAESDPTAGVTNIPMQAPIVRMPARVDKDHSTSVSGGLTVSRKAETVATGTSRMSFEQVKLEAFSLYGGAYVTEELLSDSPASFVAILAKGFTDQFGYHMINERLNGTGVGEHLGVTNSNGPIVSIAKESSQPAATITYNNVLAMRARVWGYGSAVWLANHNCLPQLAKMNSPVGTGGSLVYQSSAAVDVPDMLLGRPIYYTEYAKTLGTTGDILCCNFGEYLEGVYQPLQSAESIHVRFLNNERTFKFWLRNAGAPWWKTALTPKNGDTLSPFVKLDARA